MLLCLIRSCSLGSPGIENDRMCIAVPVVLRFIQSVLARVTEVDQLADAPNVHVGVESLAQSQIEIVIREVVSWLNCNVKLERVNSVSCGNRKIYAHKNVSNLFPMKLKLLYFITTLSTIKTYSAVVARHRYEFKHYRI